jgi:hypothetical protein
MGGLCGVGLERGVFSGVLCKELGVEEVLEVVEEWIELV